MSNPTLESTIHEILDLKRMREELDAEITALEDSIKAAIDKVVLAAADACIEHGEYVRLDVVGVADSLGEILGSHVDNPPLLLQEI